ncbi:MAG: hypothetical protein M1300_11885 [Epsilonproteobacteria bacterium]|nr:hypothetical protein [Campylobacterota bacterium]
MTLEQVASNAEFILIEGDRGTGKNMLSIFFTTSSHLDQATIIVTIPEETYYKKQEITKSMMNEDSFEFAHILLLSEDWKQTKRQLGLKFIINDIEKLLDTTGAKILYIQRIDLLFDMMDQLDSFEIISDIARLVLSRKVKTIVSLLKPSDNYLSIHDALLNYADLTLSISNDNQQKGRLVNVVASFYPLEHAVYSFVYRDNRFELNEKYNEPLADTFPPALHDIRPAIITPDVKPNKKETIDILIVSQNDPLAQWNEYLFGNLARVSLRRFRELLEMPDEIWTQSDLIIYSNDKMESILNFYTEAKFHNPIAKTIGILTRGFVRAEDKVDVHQLGGSEIFAKNIRVLDYVLGIEKTLDNSFYSNNIHKSIHATMVDSSMNFADFIEAELKLRRIFTVFVFNYTAAFQNELLNTVFREEDLAYLDEDNHKLYLLLINAQKEDHQILWKKLLMIKEDMIYENAFEAPELFSGKELLFERTFGMDK